ncbi:response regulator [candidate division WWE3 bacterium]|nr:response regulator [candidate division WWE3 bacterium]
MEKKRVLIIEDESNIREVYSEVLKDASFLVEESTDGEDGMSKAMKGEWDVMLLDIMLPKKDGLEILSSVKRLGNLKNKPVILLTNLGRDSIVKEGYTLGASGYLIKSEITPGDVLNTVKKVLGVNE